MYFEEGKDVCQGDDGFVRTEPLAQGALDGLDEVHSVLLSAFTRVAARKRRRMNARRRGIRNVISTLSTGSLAIR